MEARQGRRAVHRTVNGLCECGCGEPTTVVKGRPRRYIRDHYRRSHATPVERFWSQTAVATDLSPNGWSGCVLWTGALATGGYGMSWNGHRSKRAHRYAYEMIVGDIPGGLELDHLCRRRDCVNPGHLEPVTAAENKRRSGGMKLTATDVADIRYLRSAGWGRADVAAAYGIVPGYVSAIAGRRAWAAD